MTNLKKSLATLNEKLAGAFDGMGVRRSFTVPYTEGHSAADHIKTVGMVADQHGGLTSNLLSSYHHEGKKGWGSGEGETVGHPVNKLQSTIIPKGNGAAKDAIDAAQNHLNGFKQLLGKDDPDTQTAQNQLDLVKRTDGAGMNLFDFGAMLQQIMFKLTQKVTRTHVLANAHTPQSEMESGMGHAEPQEAQGEAEAVPEGSSTSSAQSGPESAAGPSGEASLAAAPPQSA